MHKPWLHQVLCSVNVAIVVVSMLSQTGNSGLLGLSEYPASTYLFPLLRAIYHESSFERSYGFYAASLLLAALIYSLIRVVNYFSRLRPLLLVSGEAASVAAYPLGCLWSLWMWTRISSTQALWLLLETAAVIVFVVLYFYRRWPTRPLLGIFPLAAHFGLWAWLSGRFELPLNRARAYGLSNPALWNLTFNALFLPILGLLCSLTWKSVCQFDNWICSPSRSTLAEAWN